VRRADNDVGEAVTVELGCCDRRPERVIAASMARDAWGRGRDGYRLSGPAWGPGEDHHASRRACMWVVKSHHGNARDDVGASVPRDIGDRQ
jgi:hypothetical protein